MLAQQRRGPLGVPVKRSLRKRAVLGLDITTHRQCRCEQNRNAAALGRRVEPFEKFQCPGRIAGGQQGAMECMMPPFERPLIVLAIFAGLHLDPVLNMFTWISQIGTLGVLGMMTVTSLSVIVFLRRRQGRGLGAVDLDPACLVRPDHDSPVRLHLRAFRRFLPVPPAVRSGSFCRH
jgi:hypothetical protein